MTAAERYAQSLIMSLTLPSLVLVLLATTLCAQQPRSPADLPPAHLEALTQRMGGDPFTIFGNWRPGDEQQPAWLPEAGDGDDAWHHFLHSALWHDDHRVAYRAATMLPYGELDLRAGERWLTVAWPQIFAAEDAPDFSEVRRRVSSREVARLLAVEDRWRAEVRPFFLVDMHRVMRPEHAALLVPLALCDDPFLRRGAFQDLGTLAGYSDQGSEHVAKALLSLQEADLREEMEDPFQRSLHVGYSPRSYTLPAARPGFSPLLRACLERSFLDLDKPQFVPYLMRWVERETPAAEDRLLLLSLLDCGKPAGCWLALRTFARMPADAHVQRRLQQPPAMAPKALVLAAQHDWAALRELAMEETEALAAALEFDFEATFHQCMTVAFGDDEDAAIAAIEQLLKVADVSQAPYRRQPLLWPRLRQALDLQAEQLDFERLHHFVVSLPPVRTQKLIECYWAKVTPANLADCHAPVLEITDNIPWLERLQEWGAAAAAEVRTPALEWLLQLGDALLAEPVLRHWQQAHAGDYLLLANSQESAPARQYLQQQLRDITIDADGDPQGAAGALLAAVAKIQGLPYEVAARWADDLGEACKACQLTGRFAKLREQVLAGDSLDALIAFYRTTPLRELNVDYFGLVDDDRMRALLREVRDTPGARVQDAISELALAGDWQAKQEIDELRHRHIYGWFDDASSLVQAGGKSLALVPWLLGELETNCCRRNSAASALEFLYGFETHAISESALETQPARAHAYWQAVGPHLRWSQLAQRFEVAGH